MLLVAGACLEAPPGAELNCPAPGELPADPLLGNVLDYGFDADDAATGVIHDRSGNRLDGALKGGNLVQSGRYGLGVAHDGTGMPLVEVPTDPLLHLGTAFSLEIWVYRSRVQIGEGLIAIFDEVRQAGEVILEILPDDGLWFGIATGDCDNPVMASIAAPLAIGADEWIHVAVTWDGENARFYRNGVVAYGMPLPATPCPMNRPLTLGSTGSALLPFEGRLDEVKISNYVKTEEEITASQAHDPTEDGGRCSGPNLDTPDPTISDTVTAGPELAATLVR